MGTMKMFSVNFNFTTDIIYIADHFNNGPFRLSKQAENGQPLDRPVDQAASITAQARSFGISSAFKLVLLYVVRDDERRVSYTLVYTHTCTYVGTYIRTHMHTYIHTYIYEAQNHHHDSSSSILYSM